MKSTKPECCVRSTEDLVAVTNRMLVQPECPGIYTVCLHAQLENNSV